MAKNADSDRHARGNVRRKWMHRDARMSDSVLPDHRIALKNPDLHFDRRSPTDHGSAHHSRWGLKRQPPGHFVDRVEPDSPLRIDHAYLFTLPGVTGTPRKGPTRVAARTSRPSGFGSRSRARVSR